MSFYCPDCQRPTLEIGLRMELPSDSRSDEIAVQIVTCSACGFAGVGVYEESRRGALDSESWDHTVYRMPPAALEQLRQALRRCPDPANPRCPCESHQRLGRRNETGRWVGPEGLGPSFALVRAR